MYQDQKGENTSQKYSMLSPGIPNERDLQSLILKNDAKDKDQKEDAMDLHGYQRTHLAEVAASVRC